MSAPTGEGRPQQTAWGCFVNALIVVAGVIGVGMLGFIGFVVISVLITEDFSIPQAVVNPPPTTAETLVEARRGFKTRLTRQERDGTPPEKPARLFDLVHYDAAPGKLAAYLTPDPKDGTKHAAIIWITGGDCNTIGPVWEDLPADNDQAASAYRKAGIVMMFPSLRGGNDNPGVKEGFLGEVDDVVAAAEFL
ncbi:MAG: alpha/beta hydrolase family protein, partial [Gemmataceae bacterium]